MPTLRRSALIALPLCTGFTLGAVLVGAASHRVAAAPPRRSSTAPYCRRWRRCSNT
jgi:hypothetical protein